MSYLPPTAFLPPPSQLPFHGSLPASAGRALWIVEDLLARHDAAVLSPAELASGLGALRGALLGLLAAVRPLRDEIARTTTAETSWQALRENRDYEDDHVLEVDRLYDTHFRVFRVAGLDVAGFAGQVACTFSSLLADLPSAMLSREVLRDLLTGLQGALERLPNGGAPAEAETAVPWPWPQDGLVVARFRWLTGHHAFALFSLLTREALERAATSVAEPEGFAAALEDAGRFLAATSAAMHYTTNFPARFYQEVLRPEMEGHGMPGGFSGSQNTDYNHLKMAKGRLTAAVGKGHGCDASAWPARVRESLRAFHQLDLLDIDHHVLVAAAMIGTGRSLKQIHAGAAEADSALEGLRRIAEVRRREFPV